jgi:hypothetical protein
MGFLMLLFSATMAQADDYQIIPGGVVPSGTVQWNFYALVVDVTSGLMYICSGTLDETNLATTSVKCQKMQTQKGVSILPGPVALAPITRNSDFRFPGIWQALGGRVTFCTNNTSIADTQYQCATTKLQ